MTAIDWETEIVAILEELSQVQDALFEVLAEKRACMANRDWEGMGALDQREQEVCTRLEACHDRRQQLLRVAKQRRLPCESLGKLAASAAVGGREKLAKKVNQAAARMQLLQHESLTNWVAAQRSLLHFAQMLEILATGGRPDPTYRERGAVAHVGGSLMNQEA